MIKNRERYHRAFALPTVLITSAVMMIILLVALTSVSSISVSLDGQYYNKLAREAGESGLAMAKACVAEVGSATWSSSSPLHPNTDCGGGPSCVGGDQCYVLSSANTRTTFTVGTPARTTDGAYLITAIATTQLLRTSNGEVWKTYRESVATKVKIGWKQISSNYIHSCGVTLDSKGYCWGYNYYGQLGNGATSTSYAPVSVALGEMPLKADLKMVVAGYQSSCGISAVDSKVYCWGDNAYGQLGNGTTDDTLTPKAVSLPTNIKFKSIAAGYRHTCALTTASKLYCWGYNAYGQVGNGSTATPVTLPVAISPAMSFKQVALGYYHTCAINTVNKVYCWGYNAYGQVGNGSTATVTSPTAASTNISFNSISLGYYHSCALDASSKAYCWGYPYYGQLGNGTSGTSASVTTPTAILDGEMPAGSALTTLAASRYHTCATTINNAYCWGYNYYGQLGDGTTNDTSVPKKVYDLGVLNGKQVKSMTEGLGYNTCVLDTNNKAYCWGYNAYGQLGTGATGNSSVPVGSRTITDGGTVY